MHHTIKVRNVNGALSEGMLLLGSSYKAGETATRNGPVRRAHGPVLIETCRPDERVLFSGLRKANPFFHLMEGLWMLAGRNDLPWLTHFNKQMATYSDDGGKTQPAAYGHRWRHHFCVDQLDAVVDHLTQHPTSRRAVIAMWHPGDVESHVVEHDRGPRTPGEAFTDLQKATAGSKDVPCNTQIYLQLETTEEGTQLNMTITCRSNDALWGAHGANAVHFSVLQEYLAARLTASLQHPVKIGRMYQFANDYHYYTDILKCSPEGLALDAANCDYYARGAVEPMRMFPAIIDANTIARFEHDLGNLVDYADPRRNPLRQPHESSRGGRRELGPPTFKTKWFGDVALPMLRSWDAWKQHDLDTAMDYAQQVTATDWRLAATTWMERQNRS